MKLARFAFTATLLIALGTAACGTASSAQPPQGAATSRVPAAERFAAAADRICANQNQLAAALGNGLINADIVTTAHLPKAARYLEKIVSIRRTGLPGLRRLAAAGQPADRARQQAFIQAYQKVIADYQDAAQAASQGNLAAFRTDFARVAPHGYPTGPDAKALNRASAPFPFKACGRGGSL